MTKPMTTERLEEIEREMALGWWIGDAYAQRIELLAEVKRLHARAAEEEGRKLALGVEMIHAWADAYTAIRNERDRLVAERDEARREERAAKGSLALRVEVRREINEALYAEPGITDEQALCRLLHEISAVRTLRERAEKAEQRLAEAEREKHPALVVLRKLVSDELLKAEDVVHIDAEKRRFTAKEVLADTALLDSFAVSAMKAAILLYAETAKGMEE